MAMKLVQIFTLTKQNNDASGNSNGEDTQWVAIDTEKKIIVVSGIIKDLVVWTNYADTYGDALFQGKASPLWTGTHIHCIVHK